jgi:ubiquinol-cytochrome c reductase cytochrome b subunit
MQHDYFPRYEPKSAFGKWLDDRLPITRLSYDSFVAYPVPRNLNYWYTFGGILALMLAVQIVTGVVLAMHYVASADVAFESVEKIMRDVNYGWLLRYIHSNGASFFFLAVYVHIFRGLYYGSYKAPREVLWILGVIILLLMMATAFMGYVLPWGQMSFWGATVITNLFSAIPLVGEAITTWLWGGFAVGDATLNRFYSLHYLLPFMIVGVVVLHVWALHVAGQTNPTGIEVKSKQDVVPFTPHATMKDGFSMVLFIIVFAWFVFYIPNYLNHADNFNEANPLQTPAHIVPEWYLLPFYAILRAIPNKLLGVVMMFGSIGVLFLVPWLDTSRVRSAVYRPLYKQFFWVLVAVAIGLGYFGSQPADGGFFRIEGGEEGEVAYVIPYVVIARILTAYYFIHFLVLMPLLGLFETPRTRPASIAEAVLPAVSGSGQPAESAAAPETRG